MGNQIYNKTPQVVSLRLLMLKKNLSTEQLAACVGISKASLENFYSFPEASTPLQQRIEAYFECAIWSSPEDFTNRRCLKKVLNADPCQMKFRALQLAAKEHRVKGWTRVQGKAGLIRLLAERLCDHKQPETAIKEKRK